jgi:hypothetical protein
MTDMESIIKSKIAAVEGLIAAAHQLIEPTTEELFRFMDTWRDGMKSLLPNELLNEPLNETGVREWNAGDSEPKGIDSVIDCDGDRWYRSATAGLWTTTEGSLGGDRWERLTGNYGPLTLPS